MKTKKECSLVSALTGTITDSSDSWLVDSGASRHMTGYRNSLKSLTEKNSSLQVELGDNARYAVKGVGTTSFQLESGNSLNMNDVLFVPGLRKNLLLWMDKFLYGLRIQTLTQHK
jgi:hypothetical protein